MVNLTRVEQIGSIDAGSQSPRSFFSDLSPARRSDPEAAPLLTTIVTRDDSASNGCSSTSSVAVVTRGSSNNANTTRLTPTLEHVYEAAWVDESRIVVASRGLPLHLYDIEGCHVASFGAQDAWSGSFEQAYSTTCEEGGRVLYAGSANALYSWEVERPGNEILCCMYPRWDDEYRDISLGNETRPCARRRRKHDIVSSVAAGGGKQLVALGAYSGRVALFDMRTGMQEMFIDGLSSAVTQVAFHDDTQALVVACRAKGAGLSGDSDVPDLYVFDMRGSLGRGACLYEVCRQLADDGRATRRVRFGLSAVGNLVVSGVGGGSLFKLWDLRDGREVGGVSSAGLQTGHAAVNACCFGPSSDGTLATAAGGFSSTHSRIALYKVD